jgi:hypothetical protein
VALELPDGRFLLQRQHPSEWQVWPMMMMQMQLMMM